MTQSCPSSRRRSSGKWKRSIDAGARTENKRKKRVRESGRESDGMGVGWDTRGGVVGNG